MSSNRKEEEVRARISYVLPHDMDRIYVTAYGERVTVTLDTHGMKTRTAKKAITDIIKLFHSCPFTLKVVHGHRNGLATKDMLWYQIWPEFRSRVRAIRLDPDNEGVSICTIV
jgi:hypothetical protein